MCQGAGVEVADGDRCVERCSGTLPTVRPERSRAAAKSKGSSTGFDFAPSVLRSARTDKKDEGLRYEEVDQRNSGA